jgi:hypothetical protein
MRSKWLWIVLSSVLIGAICFVPESSLLSVKKSEEGT